MADCHALEAHRNYCAARIPTRTTDASGRRVPGVQVTAKAYALRHTSPWLHRPKTVLAAIKSFVVPKRWYDVQCVLQALEVNTDLQQ
jgi:hypothetical protein